MTERKLTIFNGMNQGDEERRGSRRQKLSILAGAVAVPLLVVLANLGCKEGVDNSLAIYDGNGDGRISQVDVDRAGDFTGDGKVDDKDGQVVKKHWDESGIVNTTPKPTETDEFPPGQLLVEFDPKLSEADVAEIYEGHRLKRLGDLGRPNKHLIQFASQNPDEL